MLVRTFNKKESLTWLCIFVLLYSFTSLKNESSKGERERDRESYGSSTVLKNILYLCLTEFCSFFFLRLIIMF